MAATDSSNPAPVPIGDGEATTIKQAAFVANVAPDTVNRWCRVYGIGRQFLPRMPWRVSLPALRMVVAGDSAALEAFRAGERSSPLVARYLETEVAA